MPARALSSWDEIINCWMYALRRWCVAVQEACWRPPYSLWLRRESHWCSWEPSCSFSSTPWGIYPADGYSDLVSRLTAQRWLSSTANHDSSRCGTYSNVSSPSWSIGSHIYDKDSDRRSPSTLGSWIGWHCSPKSERACSRGGRRGGAWLEMLIACKFNSGRHSKSERSRGCCSFCCWTLWYATWLLVHSERFVESSKLTALELAKNNYFETKFIYTDSLFIIL